MRFRHVLKNGLVWLLVLGMTVQSMTMGNGPVFAAEERQTELAAQRSELSEVPNVTGSVTASASDVYQKTLDDYLNDIGTYSIRDDIPTYKEYVATYPNIETTEPVHIAASDFLPDATDMTAEVVGNENYAGTGKVPVEQDGQSLLTAEEGYVSWKFTAPQTGYYYIGLTYYPVTGKNAAIERAVFLDGTLPYAEFSSVQFSRIWTNDINVKSDETNEWSWKKDNQNNDLKPTQMEIPDWMQEWMYDSNGYISGELPIYIEQGEHVLTLVSIREPMLISDIDLTYRKPLPTYREYKQSWDDKGAVKANSDVIIIEGESTDRKSSQMLYPQQDQSSPAVSPYSPRYLLNNTIGGRSWRMVGQWIEWDFDVPEDGYYTISMNVRQNFSKGIYVSRRISFDGEVPFREFEAYGFKYKARWRTETLSDDNGDAYYLYFTKGHHVMKMDVVLGEFASVVSDVQLSVTKLNSIYREILCITGPSPDAWKDYQINANIPKLGEECSEVKELLDDVITRLRDLVGKGSDKETVLITMRDQLEDIIDDPEYIVKIVSSFRTNIRACGNWITQVIDQPLAIDAIYITPDTKSVPKTNNSWWARFLHELKRLFYSFIIDYNMIGDVSDGGESVPITLWVGTGRDQANVIKSMIDETFSTKSYTDSNGNTYNISVNVMLVDINSLLQATLAGSGPDVAIQVANDWPMNYGIRNAVMDLSQFPDCEEITGTRFRPSAMEAFTFESGGVKHVYGLPETQTFAMMFYRKDILSELNLDVPKTWDDMKVVLTVLSQNNMDVGMLPTESNFAMLLYQNNGEYYNESGSKSMLDSEEGVMTFRKFTEFYTDYGMDTNTSVEERFRTGEAPIVITDYNYYNTLQVSAPDIKGLWGMSVVPGEKKTDADGNEYIDNTVASSGTACVIMKATKEKEACWEFLKWWTDTETQYLYSSEMESLMGASARVATANIEAFDLIPWPTEIAKELKKQFANVRGIRQVPGGYFTWRNVNNAFYSITTNQDAATPREELMDRVIYINEEIAYKRAEFNLDD